MTELPAWFVNDGQPNFEKILLPAFAGKSIRILQIGAYTGDASVWLGNNILSTNSSSILIDVDTWDGSDEPAHKKLNWDTVEAVYDAKTIKWRQERKIVKYKGTSDSFFANNREMYDFIYVDGDHTSYGVIKDAINSYESLNVGGFIAFDDYQWSAGLGAENEPKMAIDSFRNIYKDRVELALQGYQCWFRKIK
jgi:predicted O-methyltransferase YrrM